MIVAIIVGFIFQIPAFLHSWLPYYFVKVFSYFTQHEKYDIYQPLFRQSVAYIFRTNDNFT